MKKLLILLSSAILLTGLLTACQSGEEQQTEGETKHKHTFETEWSTDEDSHWYEATCGCPNLQGNFATHTDADKDGTCDICFYDGNHEHTFKEEWAYDETNHWHAADCQHAVKKDEAPHADTNNDGLCDGCAWNFGHEHTYAKEWNHDAEFHWHDATCGHTVEGSGKSAHKDADNNGICDGCKWNYDHTHTFAETWSHDAEKHWKDTTCDHSVVTEEAPHADVDNNGVCDGCAWDYDHTHTYETDNWTQNDTHHWHKANCGHDVEGIDVEAHVDADENRSCDVCEYDYDHVHTYNTDAWSWDRNSHFHEATCGHAVRADEETHKDANNDGLCDVCRWNYDHAHSFDSNWTYDKTNHWRAATCGHDVKDKVMPHEDLNNDKSCDVCAWDYDHTHSFDKSKLTIGTDTHYYAPSCGCNPQYVRGEETPHEDEDYDDRCDICGGFVSLEIVVDNATAEETAGLIKEGTIDLTFNASNYKGNVAYEFGSGYLHILDNQTYGNETNQYNNSYEYWYDLSENGSVFAIAKEDGDPFRNLGAESIFMQGYYFSGEFISYAFNCYGVEELLYQLYGMHISVDFAGACTQYMEFYDQTSDTYSFSFLYGGLYVGVDFRVNAQGAVTYLKMVTGASADAPQSTIIINQKTGERTAINPYDPDTILINSYDIVDINGKQIKDGDVIHMVTGADYKLDLQIQNMLPTTANSAFDRVQISCSDPEAVLTFAGTAGNMIVNAQKEGTYTVSFTTEKMVKTITIIVVYPAPKVIKGQVYDANGGYATYDEYTMYLGDVMHFVAGVADHTDGRYTAVITENGANATLSDATIEVLREPVNVTAFTPAKVGKYVITITSVADPSVTCTLTVNVTEKIEVSDILNGTWVFSTTYKIVFTPEAPGATKGTFEVTHTPKSGDAKSAIYSYEYKTDGLEITYVSGDEFTVKLSITAKFQLKYGAYTMKRPE